MRLNFLKLAFILLLAALCNCHLSAQSVLKLTELTNKGKLIGIEPIVKNDSTTLVYCKYPNVDINSLIKIDIDKAKINQAANNWVSAKNNLPVDRIKGVSDILSKRAELIKAIQFDSTNLSARKVVLQKFSDNIGGLLSTIYNLEPGNPLKTGVTNVFAQPNLTSSERYNKVFDLLQKEIDSIGSAYKENVEQNKVFFRLGSFVNNVPVHLEGFDNYKEGDYYFVPPFITTIPENQKSDFQKYQQLASQANKDGLKAFSDQFQKAITPFLDSLKKKLQEKFSGPLTSFKGAVSSLKNISSEVDTEIDNNKEKVNNLIASIEILKSNLKDVNQADYLTNLTESISKVSNDYKLLEQSVGEFITNQEKKTIPELKSALAELKTGFEEGKKLIDNEIETFKGFVGSNVLQQISQSKKIDQSLLKLGDEVNNLPLDNIPDQTILDLSRTVVRKNGDRLIFKSVLAKSPQGNKKEEEKIIDYTSIGLYQIGLHNSIQATMILVDNLSGTFDSKKQFQFAPSYSVLFKYGKRKSSFYNDFIDFGVGVNMATLDFNKDDNPEVGIGMVFSSFKDYLQIGLGRNLGVDQNYWFFGIRLPFLGLNLDGKPKIASTE